MRGYATWDANLHIGSLPPWDAKAQRRERRRSLLNSARKLPNGRQRRDGERESRSGRDTRNRTWTTCSQDMDASHYTISRLVDTERIELSSSGCRPEILPLNDAPTAARAVCNRIAVVPIFKPAAFASTANPMGCFGAGGGTRNPTRRFTGPLLCLLSYTSKFGGE